MNDLVDFLRARLAEDEQAARECGGAPWSAPIPGQIHVDAKAIADNKLALGQLGYVATVLHEQDRRHIVRHDPARVLREVEAKRRILERHRPEYHLRIRDGAYAQDDDPHCPEHLDGRPWPCADVRDMAAVYADHPDYREEWRL